MCICKCAYVFTITICNEPNTVETDIPHMMNNFQVHRAVNFCLHQHWRLDYGHWIPYAVLKKLQFGIAQLNVSAMLKRNVYLGVLLKQTIIYL